MWWDGLTSSTDRWTGLPTSVHTNGDTHGRASSSPSGLIVVIKGSPDLAHSRLKSSYPSAQKIDSYERVASVRKRTEVDMKSTNRILVDLQMSVRLPIDD